VATNNVFRKSLRVGVSVLKRADSESSHMEKQRLHKLKVSARNLILL
jgi:hypothetical protein